MKQWMKKLVDQIEAEWGKSPSEKPKTFEITEERATLLYILDNYSKHLFEIETHPVRKVRAEFDEFTRELVKHSDENLEKTFFRLRQFFTTYRLEEFAFVEKTFDDFKKIVWDFADQLGEELDFEKANDKEVGVSLEQLRDAVESNSIDALKKKSRELIGAYAQYQAKRDERREKRITSIKKNLTVVKKQLVEAKENMRFDHLTGAYSRKAFDERMAYFHHLFKVAHTPISLLALDIDHFKIVNDTYGHEIGDFVLKECVRILREAFTRESEIVARIGGEEFAIILPDYTIKDAVKRGEEVLAKIRKDVFVHGSHQIRFTMSMGIAQLLEGESVEHWLKRADTALYDSKKGGRDRYTVAPHPAKMSSVA